MLLYTHPAHWSDELIREAEGALWTAAKLRQPFRRNQAAIAGHAAKIRADILVQQAIVRAGQDAVPEGVLTWFFGGDQVSEREGVTEREADGGVTEDEVEIADSGGVGKGRATAGELKSFAQTGLPQYQDLAADARKVLATIGAVADRIGRDPGRFFLGNQTPDYRN